MALPDHAMRSGPREVRGAARMLLPWALHAAGGWPLLPAFSNCYHWDCLACTRPHLACARLPARLQAAAAGPWHAQTIYHNPKETHVAITTVGGICPGLNDVVRSLVHKVRSLVHWGRGWGREGGWWAGGEISGRGAQQGWAHALLLWQSRPAAGSRCHLGMRCGHPPCPARPPAPCSPSAHPAAAAPAAPPQCLDYGVPEANILGIRYGFRGFYDRDHKPVALTRR